MPPPTEQELPDGTKLDLVSLAFEVCRRYREEFPDEAGRYGEPGMDWCRHDNQHIFQWAALALQGVVDLEEQLSWLGSVLEARDFPLERLARNLEIASEVASKGVPDTRGEPLAEKLAKGANFIRSHKSFI